MVSFGLNVAPSQTRPSASFPNARIGDAPCVRRSVLYTYSSYPGTSCRPGHGRFCFLVKPSSRERRGEEEEEEEEQAASGLLVGKWSMRFFRVAMALPLRIDRLVLVETTRDR